MPARSTWGSSWPAGCGSRRSRGSCARSRDAPPTSRPQRSAALTALAAIDPQGSEALLKDVLLDAVGGDRAARDGRRTAGGERDGRGVVHVLVDALPVAPGRLQAAIAAALARGREGAEALLDAIAAGKASARLLQEQPVAVALEQREPAEAGGAARHRCSPACPRPTRSSAALMTGAGPGSGRRPGRTGPKRAPRSSRSTAASATSSAARERRVGPQLDGIGSRGLDRLVEDILDPNRNVDQTFRTTNLALENGQVVSGLLLREEGEVLVLADAQGKEVRVPKASVEERKTSPLSPMPANLPTRSPRTTSTA